MPYNFYDRDHFLCKLRWHISLLSPALVGIWSIPACTHTSRQVPALRSGAFLTNCEKTAYFATNISIHPFSEFFFISHACHFWLISLFSLIPPFPFPPPPPRAFSSFSKRLHMPTIFCVTLLYNLFGSHPNHFHCTGKCSSESAAKWGFGRDSFNRMAGTHITSYW